MSYPKRRELSADDRLFTRDDGSVLERTRLGICHHSSLSCLLCKMSKCKEWSVVEFAYVPSDGELKTCDMVREAIEMCSSREDGGCFECGYTEDCDNPCVLRHFLCQMQQPDAWDIKP